MILISLLHQVSEIVQHGYNVGTYTFSQVIQITSDYVRAHKKFAMIFCGGQICSYNETVCACQEKENCQYFISQMSVAKYSSYHMPNISH